MPVVVAEAVAVQPMQQMQVVIPYGVTGGSPFKVDTPAGQMKVVCPPDLKGGDTIIVNVPGPVASQPIMPTQPVMPMSMSRGPPPAFDINTLQDGWYGVNGCPTCCCMHLGFNEDKSAITWGPCCCWNVVPVPCVVPYGLTAAAPGSASFWSADRQTNYVFQGPDTFKDVNWNGDYKKFC